MPSITLKTPKIPEHWHVPHNVAWWWTVGLAMAMVIFMIVALVRDDAEKKWRWISLGLGVGVLGICIAGCFSQGARNVLFKCTPEADQPTGKRANLPAEDTASYD